MAPDLHTPEEAPIKREWHTPNLHAFEIGAVTQTDPTISDDGLGDGLFS
jgi:hypothetical protein